MDGHRGEWTERDGRFAPHEHSGRPSWECRTTTQDEHLQKFHNEIGFIPGYRGFIPGRRNTLGTSPVGAVPRRTYFDVVSPDPPPRAPRSASENHRRAFRLPHHVAQEEHTLKQHRLQGVNRFAPFGVDVCETDRSTVPLSARSQSDSPRYLAVPEESCGTLWPFVKNYGKWCGYSNKPEGQLLSERRAAGRAPNGGGPHARMRRDRELAEQRMRAHAAKEEQLMARWDLEEAREARRREVERKGGAMVRAEMRAKAAAVSRARPMSAPTTAIVPAAAYSA